MLIKNQPHLHTELEERAGVQAPLQVKGLKIEAQVQAWDFSEHIEGGRTQLQIGRSEKTIPFQNIISTKITEVDTGSCTRLYGKQLSEPSFCHTFKTVGSVSHPFFSQRGKRRVFWPKALDHLHAQRALGSSGPKGHEDPEKEEDFIDF